MQKADKPLIWLHAEVRTPPFSAVARVEAGVLEVFGKTTRQTPKAVIKTCKKRLSNYVAAIAAKETKQ